MSLLRPADILILALGAAIVGASYGAFWSERIAGDLAAVSVGQREVARIPLASDGDFPVDGILGESVLRVGNGQVI